MQIQAKFHEIERDLTETKSALSIRNNEMASMDEITRSQVLQIRSLECERDKLKEKLVSLGRENDSTQDEKCRAAIRLQELENALREAEASNAVSLLRIISIAAYVNHGTILGFATTFGLSDGRKSYCFFRSQKADSRL